MGPEEILQGDTISITVGDGVSRRDVLKQAGAASALLGTAGCLSDGRGETPSATGEPTTADPTTEAPATETRTGTSTMPPEKDTETETPPGAPEPRPSDVRTASRHPAVAPPGWDPAKTASGDGQSERRAVLVSQLQVSDLRHYMPMAAGFHDALNQLGWTGAVRGPPTDGGIQDQVNIIHSEIDRMEEGDVIVTTILNNTSYNAAIQSALDNGIVVVNSNYTPATRDWNYDVMREEIGFTYTSPVTGEDQEMIVPHVGIRNNHVGATVAAEAHERLRRRVPDQDEYTVFLVNDLPANPNVTRRLNADAAETGTAQRYFEAQDDVEIYQDQVFDAGPDPSIENSRTFVVDNIQGEDVDAVVASAFWAAAGTGWAINEGELSADVLVCGFDLDELIDPIRTGNVDFTVGQDLYGQGYHAATMARNYLERGIPMRDLEWGVSVWDEDNVAFADQRESWGDLLEWQRTNYTGPE